MSWTFCTKSSSIFKEIINELVNKQVNKSLLCSLSKPLNFYIYGKPITVLFSNLHNLSTTSANLSGYLLVNINDSPLVLSPFL